MNKLAKFVLLFLVFSLGLEVLGIAGEKDCRWPPRSSEAAQFYTPHNQIMMIPYGFHSNPEPFYENKISAKNIP